MAANETEIIAEGRGAWRLARQEDDQAIIAMCRELNREDPGPEPVPDEHMIRTLSTLRLEAIRGKAIVFEQTSEIAGYALLASFWSNELGGEVCYIDELFVKPLYRGRGYASGLIKDLIDRKLGWFNDPVAIELEVTPQNAKARALYTKLGFKEAKNAHMRKFLKHMR